MKTLIRNGLFFDGTGAPGVVRDVLVVDGVVAPEADAVAADPSAVDRVIEAHGQWVMPGFVDMHTHYDAEILAGPGLNESVRHGVTTVFLGSCSLSTILSSPEDCADFFTRVEALPRDQVLPALQEHKTWSTPAQYIEGLERRPLGPNVACFLGHSDLRTSVMGLARAVDGDERPTRDEQARMEQCLEDALDAGYLGLSTMTNPWDKVGGDRHRSKRLPSTYATWGEYRRFHRILRRRERVLQSAPNITTKVNVLLFLAASGGWGVRRPLKTTLISAADTKANPALSDAITAVVAFTNRAADTDFRWQTVPMPFEVYADGMDLVVFEEFAAGEAALHLADELQRNALLKDEAYRRAFRKDYDKRFSPRVWHRNFHDAEIVAAPDPVIVGRTFGELADLRDIHPVDAFLDLVVQYGSKLRWRTTIANHRPRKLVELASHDSVHVGFSDAGAHVRNMAFYNFGLYYLRSIRDAAAAGDPVVPLEQAVHKVTGELADWYGIDAGHLRPGDRADLVIVDPAGLDATLDDYHEAPMDRMGGLSRMVRRNDAAVTATMISGEVVYERGRFVAGYGRARRYGSFLRVGVKAPPVLQTLRSTALSPEETPDAHRAADATYTSRAS
ncbi:MAG: amidohydrolase family protein [Myxococcales bacterium]|nr:amidohydrolase family protein [Myxococcales bacterium]